MMENRWIFVLTEYSNYNLGSVDSTLEELKQDRNWKIGLKTVHRNELSIGDEAIFYVSGNDRRCFVAYTSLLSEFVYEGDPIYGYVRLNDIHFFEKPVYIKPIIQRLHFITNKKYWGSSLQNGIVRINDHDKKIILQKSKIKYNLQ